MSTQISWLLVVAIQPGQLDLFRAVARDLIASTQNESGTLAYEWNLSEDNSVCQIYERYRDSTAMITHVTNFGKFAERFIAACRPVRFDVYGPISAEAKALIKDFGPVYYSHLGGFSR